MKSKSIFEPFQLGSLLLQNRIVMAPMTRARGIHEGHLPTEIMETYYEQRSTAGLIISEGIVINDVANGYHNIPGVYNSEQVKRWKKITGKVHANGGKIFAQIWHVGRVSHPEALNGKQPLAPSAINPHTFAYTPTGPKDTITPREMTLSDIRETVADFKQAAINCIEAGFDGIELHAANGYLFHQFLATSSNQRTDDYGGNVENRARFALEVLDGVVQGIGADRVGIRLNPDLDGIAGINLNQDTTATFDYLIGKLEHYSLAYLHITSAMMDIAEGDAPTEKILRTVKRYRNIYRNTLMLNGGFDQNSGQEAIDEGLADLIAIGASFVANPDLIYRFRHNLPLAAADPETLYAGTEKGYIDYPLYRNQEIL